VRALYYFFVASRRRHTRFSRDWSSDVCSSDLETVQAELHDAGKGAVEFLQGDGAFTGYHAEVERIAEDARTIGTAADAAPLAALLDAQNEGLEVVTEVVGDLDLTDPTARTAILVRVGDVFGA